MRRVERPFAEHGLGRVLVEVAARAAARFLEQGLPRCAKVSARCDLALGGERVLEAFGGSRGIAPRPCDHLDLPRAGAGNQRLNERGLRHVAPIFLRHLLQHRADLKARRVEDGRVIGLPHRLERIAAGRFGTGRARAFAHAFAVPVDRELGRKDRPAHVGKAAHEEAGGVADDMMLGLEVGDEPGRAAGLVRLQVQLRHVFSICSATSPVHTDV